MNMLEVLGVDPQEGEIGIEIELEGRNLPKEDFVSWRAERDGSLRGESIELVLKKPCLREKVPARLKSMYHKLEVMGSVVHETNRAGIHVHVNIQDLTEVQLVNFICLYMTYENTLVNFCGANRVGNLFCLRTCDASGYIDLLRDSIQTRRWHRLKTDEVRYASMNLKAVVQYGSLEFRAMRSTIDVDVIQTWVDLLLSLKDRAKAFDNPIEIIEQFSMYGMDVAFEKTFGDLAEKLEFDPGEMMVGIRNAQLVAYCRPDWDEVEQAPDMIDEIRFEVDEMIEDAGPDVRKIRPDERMKRALGRKCRDADMLGEKMVRFHGYNWYRIGTEEWAGVVANSDRWLSATRVVKLHNTPTRLLNRWEVYCKSQLTHNMVQHAMGNVNLMGKVYD